MAEIEQDSDPTAPVFHIERRKESADWYITTGTVLTDEEAQAVTFKADPLQVVMGDFVELEDPASTRIGHVWKAEYVGGGWTDSPYVTVQIKLR